MFFEEVIRENLDLGRPDEVQLLFDRKIIPHHAWPLPDADRNRRRDALDQRLLQEHAGQAVSQGRPRTADGNDHQQYLGFPDRQAAAQLAETAGNRF
jgi:hypothetical protein